MEVWDQDNITAFDNIPLVELEPEALVVQLAAVEQLMTMQESCPQTEEQTKQLKPAHRLTHNLCTEPTTTIMKKPAESSRISSLMKRVTAQNETEFSNEYADSLLTNYPQFRNLLMSKTRGRKRSLSHNDMPIKVKL